MSAQVQATVVPVRERRRSQRLPFRETVFVCGRSQDRSFKEETVTFSVSASGAFLDLAAKVSLGQKVLLMNPQTWDEREGIVRRLGETRHGRTQVAIEFKQPAPEFWPLKETSTN